MSIKNISINAALTARVSGRIVADIKIEDKEIWLDFQDGGRLVIKVKDEFNGSIHREELRVLLDNDIVHRFQLFEIDSNNIRK